PRLALYQTGRSDFGPFVSLPEIQTGVPLPDGQTATWLEAAANHDTFATGWFCQAESFQGLQLCDELRDLPCDRRSRVSAAFQDTFIYGGEPGNERLHRHGRSGLRVSGSGVPSQ